MGEYAVMRACRKVGVSLSLSEDSEAIVARPSANLTRETREGIRETKNGILRNLLFKKAVLWLSERASYERLSSTLDRAHDELDEVWLSGTLEEFRVLLRRIAREAGSLA